MLYFNDSQVFSTNNCTHNILCLTTPSQTQVPILFKTMPKNTKSLSLSHSEIPSHRNLCASVPLDHWLSTGYNIGVTDWSNCNMVSIGFPIHSQKPFIFQSLLILATSFPPAFSKRRPTSTCPRLSTSTSRLDSESPAPN